MHNEENYKQGEKTAFKWEKRIANEATDKKLISKIYHGEKTIPFTSGAGKNGQPPIKE